MPSPSVRGAAAAVLFFFGPIAAVCGSVHSMHLSRHLQIALLASSAGASSSFRLPRAATGASRRRGRTSSDTLFPSGLSATSAADLLQTMESSVGAFVASTRDIFPAAFTTTTTETSSPSSAPVPMAVPCAQDRLPLLELLPRAGYEDSLPWVLTALPPLLLAVAVDSPSPLLVALLAELSFAAACLTKVATTFDAPTVPEPLLRRDWAGYTDALWGSHPTAEARSRMFMGWFYDRPVTELRREDAAAFLAWLRFGTTPEALGPAQHRELDGDVRRLEQEMNGGLRLDGRGADEPPLPCMRFTLEPLRFRHKPLAFYGIIHGAHAWFVRSVQDSHGFDYHPTQDPAADLPYFFRPAVSPPTAGIAEAAPLVFVHGVGGLVFYKQLVEEIAAGHDGPIILLELPFISLRAADTTPSIVDQVASVVRILDEHCGKQAAATFVGHSFGSLILSWMVQAEPRRVANCVFIDPICFMLHQKDVLFNFQYRRVERRAQEGKPWNSPLAFETLNNLAATEMHTNHAMLRHFWWATNELWPEDLERADVSAAVVLSERDDIVPSAAIDAQFGEHARRAPLGRRVRPPWREGVRLETVRLAGAGHGACASEEKARARTVATVLEMAGRARRVAAQRRAEGLFRL